MKTFSVEYYNGEFHIMNDNWSMKGDADRCKSELEEWLEGVE